jgi:4-amino-4-deoxy-L-arabinose transferase-like glycosyltransferase
MVTRIGALSGRIEKWLRGAAVAGAACFFVLFLAGAVLRMRYPFELEWMEGGSLAQVERILAGQGVYVSPTIEYVPFIYPPLYFCVSAVAAWVLGPGFLPLRLVSLLSALGCFGLVFAIVKRETGCGVCAFVAGGVLAATYRICGDWFDVARVDSLCMFLTLAALYFARIGRGGSLIGAGLLFSMAFLTKQVVLAPFLSIALFYLLANRRGALFLVGAAVPASLIAVLCLDRVSQGWYSFYTFALPAQHMVRHTLSLAGLFTLYFVTLPISLCLVGSAVFMLLPQESEHAPRPRLFYALAGAGMFIASAAGWANPGGYLNVLMPACGALAVLCGLGMAKALELAAGASAGRRALGRCVVYSACVFQLAVLLYVPSVPSQEDQNAGEWLVAELREVNGDVFVPAHGYLAVLAGKTGSAHSVALRELSGGFGGEETTVWPEVYADLCRALEDRRYGLVLVFSDDYREEIERTYVLDGRVFDDEWVFWTVSGFRRRPEYKYVPRGDAGAE